MADPDSTSEQSHEVQKIVDDLILEVADQAELGIKTDSISSPYISMRRAEWYADKLNQIVLKERLEELKKLDELVPDWWKEEGTPGIYTEADYEKLVAALEDGIEQLQSQLREGEKP